MIIRVNLLSLNTLQAYVLIKALAVRAGRPEDGDLFAVGHRVSGLADSVEL
jgi:hypothetical protein